MRLSYNANWPLLEFWKDAVKPARKVINDFTEPFIRQALEQREKELASQMEAKGEDETLLAHLVKHTQDPIVLQDEVSKILPSLLCITLWADATDRAARLSIFSLLVEIRYAKYTVCYMVTPYS